MIEECHVIDGTCPRKHSGVAILWQKSEHFVALDTYEDREIENWAAKKIQSSFKQYKTQKERRTHTQSQQLAVSTAAAAAAAAATGSAVAAPPPPLAASPSPSPSSSSSARKGSSHR